MKKSLGSDQRPWAAGVASVCGSVGLLLLLFTAPISYFTVNSLVPFIVSIVLGVSCVGVWFVSARGTAGTWVRSAFFYSSSVGLTIAFLGVLVTINFIAARRAPSWDLTRKQVYSLSPQTQTLLKDLKHPIKVMVFSKDAPPDSVEELFRRYRALNDQLSWEFIDPRRSPDLTQQFRIRDGQPAVVVQNPSGEKPTHTVINLQRLMNPLLAEQELTNGILKLDLVGTQKLYFLLGHGELSLEPAAQTEEALMSSMAGLKRVLEDEGYAPTPLNLLQNGSVPADASAVVISAPRNTFSELERALIATYLSQGGRLLYFSEVGPDVGLGPVIAPYGVQLENGIVADPKVNPDNPYLVYSPFVQEHEITTPLMTAQANVFFPTTRAITRLGVGTLDGLIINPLVLTTPYAWVENTLADKPTRDDGERAGQLILAAAATVPTTSVTPRRSNEARFAIFGDADLVAGAFGVASNRDLVLNSIAWATQQGKKITIRPPDRDLSSVDLDNTTLSHIRLVSMVLLPTLLLSIGLTIWNTRRSR
ncbi:MAG: GldG family protein [Archangium sp.]|nr:GldG family protein [Archangium sp.]